MTRVAFLIDVVDSYGEREVAQRFAARLPAGVESTFVVPDEVAPRLPASLAVRPYREIAGAARALLDLAPDALVCCEYFNLPPELRDAVAGGPWRLVTTDGTAMGLEINTNPLGAQATLRNVKVPEGIVRLQNCPICDPDPDTDVLYHWATWPELARGDGAALRATWNVPAGHRVAMMAVSPWALRAADSLGQGGHYRRLVDRLVAAFAASGADVTFVVVAPQPSVRRIGRVTVRTVGYLAQDVYERLLLGCDLVVTDSVIQLSAGKAFVAGVPTLVVVNSDPRLGPPYNIFPVRLQFPRTAYHRAIAPVELGDENALAARVASAFAGEPAGGADYRAALARLRTPEEILARIVG